MELKEDDLVLCTVKKIDGATVFVELDDGTKGSLAMSEIAAGRIRNLREYVVLNKRIVCKILKKLPDHLELSLRRVGGNERDELLEKNKKEKTSAALLKAVLKNSDKTISSILVDMPLSEFIARAKVDIKSASAYLAKEELAVLDKALAERKDKEKSAKTVISLRSLSSSGINDIKEILTIKQVSVHYLGSGKFSISTIGSDFKEANQKLNLVVDKIQKTAKDKKLVFELVNKK
jgi:translation initiation factor 2 alpha subunit (eIF-2alpha)